MAQQTPLELLIELATHNSDSRIKQLGGALSRESSAAKRLQMLEDYRRDYLGTFDRAGRAGLTATALINFYNFLQKLDHAITQQSQIVAHAQAATLSARNDLRDAEIKKLSLVTLQDRRIAADRVVDARREQRQMDEISTRIAVHGVGVDPKHR